MMRLLPTFPLHSLPPLLPSTDEHRAAMQGGVGGGGFPANAIMVVWATLTCLWWAGMWAGGQAHPTRSWSTHPIAPPSPPPPPPFPT